MANKGLVVVHYLNQFFGQVGGEDKADTGFVVRGGPVGPGQILQKELGDGVQVVATVICGDNYFAQDPEKVSIEGLSLIEAYKPDFFVAGPAFAAGRYGVACGAICKAVAEKLRIPVVTGMHEENPGVEMYRRHAFICQTGTSAKAMADGLKKMARLAIRLTSGETEMNLVYPVNLPKPEDYDYFPRLVLKNEYTAGSAAQRMVDKLLLKIKGEPFESEVQLPAFAKIEPPAPISDPGSCEIALVSDGGLVPKGNPDRISGRANFRWAKYELDQFLPDDYQSGDYEIAHMGYFPDEVLANPNRLLPVDVMRDLVKEGKIGKLHPTFFSTSGNATVAQQCNEMGDKIGAELKQRSVDAVILTST